jgi:hypothetical protein
MASNATIAMNAICSPTLMPFAPEMLAQICREKAYGLLPVLKELQIHGDLTPEGGVNHPRSSF